VKKLAFLILIVVLIAISGCSVNPPRQGLTYKFVNHCTGEDKSAPPGSWHWTFQPINGTAGATIEVTIPNGGTSSGTIPLGTYMVGDRTDDGFVKFAPTERTIDGQELQFNVSLCP
jgi:hypothetical protein